MVTNYGDYIEFLKAAIPNMKDDELEINLQYFRLQQFSDGAKLIEAEMKKRAAKK